MIDEDAKLMLAFKGGDRQAFEELFRRYTPKLLNFLARMVRDRARAEELTQDVFIRVYNAAERYEPKARFSTYIFGIAHKLALNDLARAYRKRERQLEPVDEQRRDNSAASASEQLEASQTYETLERALGELPERQRAALLLRSQEGLAYQEIADSLGASVASVKSLLHRARETLLAKLSGAA